MAVRLVSAFALAAVGCLSAGIVYAQSTVEVTPAAHQDHLPSLRGVVQKPEDYTGARHVREVKNIPHLNSPGNPVDTALQSTPSVSPAAATTPGLGFDGIGQGSYGFTVNSAPPDTNAAIGSTQYIQWVNSAFIVFDKKTGNKLMGPTNGSALWSNFGGPCQTDNDGDPIVKWDNAAQRWILMQFAVPSGGPYYECVAVSQTADATGGYYLYAFNYTTFPDYPKAGIWSDAYYVTFNMFNGNTFQGAKLCAYDRAKMIAGLPATQQCAQLSPSYGGVLPADVDGASGVAPGAPNYLLNWTTNQLNLWKFHVDWANPANSIVSAPTTIPVTAFSAACGGGTCIPQAGTNNQLDSLADRLMYRLAYRYFADGHESLVVSHSIAVGSGTKRNPAKAAVRWYELRSPNTTPVVYQQGTYAPDTTTYRWMGSGAQDKLGNIAFGYSTSSSGQYPGMSYATRAPTDALGTLSNETSIIVGTGSQTGTLHRWGDYSTMVVDPTDDCTFWFTSEYLKASGTFNWSTRIASFKVSTCQ